MIILLIILFIIIIIIPCSVSNRCLLRLGSSPRTLTDWFKNDYFRRDLERKAFFADKYLVKDYISKNFKDIHVAKLLYVTDDPKTIPFDDLPKKYVIKANHGCGMNIIIKNKEWAERDRIINISKHLLKAKYKNNIFDKLLKFDEPHYELIKPKIIVEEFLEDSIIDYRFNTFFGKVDSINVTFKTSDGFTSSNKDINWNYYGIGNAGRGPITKPKNLERMIQFCNEFYEKEKFDFVRIDLYEVNNKIYLGEFTFSPDGGHSNFSNRKYDKSIYQKILKPKLKNSQA